MINWDRVRTLREEVGPEDFDEVVELFLLEVDGEMETLRETGGCDSLGEKLHFLKGSALNLGFEAFSALCRDAERQLFSDAAANVDLDAILAAYSTSRKAFLADLQLVSAA